MIVISLKNLGAINIACAVNQTIRVIFGWMKWQHPLFWWLFIATFNLEENIWHLKFWWITRCIKEEWPSICWISTLFFIIYGNTAFYNCLIVSFIHINTYGVQCFWYLYLCGLKAKIFIYFLINWGKQSINWYWRLIREILKSWSELRNLNISWYDFIWKKEREQTIYNNKNYHH